MQCAWNGEEINGKGYVLNTTEGPEVVSEKALRETRGATDKTARTRVDELAVQVEELRARLDQVTSDATAEKGDGKP